MIGSYRPSGVTMATMERSIVLITPAYPKKSTLNGMPLKAAESLPRMVGQ